MKATQYGLIWGLTLATALTSACASAGRWFDTKENVDKEFNDGNEGALADRCIDDTAAFETNSDSYHVAQHACGRYNELQAKKLAQAYEAGNFETVQGVCEGTIDFMKDPKGRQVVLREMAMRQTLEAYHAYRHEVSGIDNNKEPLRFTACAMMIANAKGNAMAELKTDVAACKPGDELYQKYIEKAFSGMNSGDQKTEAYLLLGSGMAKCKQWDFVFEKLVHWGGESGMKLLNNLSRDGHDVAALTRDYVTRKKSNVFGFKHGSHAAANLVAWLRNSNKFECDFYVKNYPNFSPDSHGEWLYYFAEGNCTKAAPFAVKRLSNGNAQIRRQACNVLGTIGSKKDIPKLQAIADNDATFEIQGLNTKVYWVRDACRNSIGKIQLRN